MCMCEGHRADDEAAKGEGEFGAGHKSCLRMKTYTEVEAGQNTVANEQRKAEEKGRKCHTSKTWTLECNLR